MWLARHEYSWSSGSLLHSLTVWFENDSIPLIIGCRKVKEENVPFSHSKAYIKVNFREFWLNGFWTILAYLCFLVLWSSDQLLPELVFAGWWIKAKCRGSLDFQVKWEMEHWHQWAQPPCTAGICKQVGSAATAYQASRHGFKVS